MWSPLGSSRLPGHFGTWQKGRVPLLVPFVTTPALILHWGFFVGGPEMLFCFCHREQKRVDTAPETGGATLVLKRY